MSLDISIRLYVNLKRLETSHFIKREDMARLVLLVQGMIRQRTLKRRGLKGATGQRPGKPMRKLLPRTVRQRKALGIPRPKGSRLTRSGKLLRSLRGRVEQDDRGAIYFDNQNERGLDYGLIAHFLQSKRFFFMGLTYKEHRKLSKFYAHLIRRRMARST